MRLTGILLAVALLAAPLAAGAQQGGKVHQIGYVSAGSREENSAAFREGLRGLGRVEGENLIIKWRWARGKNERLAELASELVRLELDVLVTITTPATQAAVAATRRIPIVFTMVADPVGSGFVANDYCVNDVLC